MTPRLEDWVRGVLRADRKHEVKAVFRCEADGHPV
jgi:hypothetical protein